MKNQKTSMQFICLAIAFLLGGCQKQTQEAEPTILNLSPSSEEQSATTAIQESTFNRLSETPDETSLQQEDIDNDAPTDQSDSSSPSLTDITKDFYPSDGWTSVFSFQLPEEWTYTVDEDITDWGFLIQVENREDSFIRIYGQYGTLNVEQFYTSSPTDFVTTSGLHGKFYQEKCTGEDGTSYIKGDIMFDFESYDVDFYMPEDIFNKNYETLQKIFQSVAIRDIIDE